MAPETSKGPALIMLMAHNGWKRAVVLASTDGVWFQSGLELERKLQAAGIEVLRPAAFEPGSIQHSQHKHATLQEIKRSGIRVVILVAGSGDTNAVSSNAAQKGMTRAGWGWVILEQRHATADMQGWLFLRSFFVSKAMKAFAEQVSDYTKSHFNISVSADSVNLAYSTALYDSVMLYAHAATKVLSEGGDLHDGQAVTEAVRSISFEGVSGSMVALDEHGDRLESYEVMNYVVGADGAMGSVPVGLYNSTGGTYSAYGREVIWPGNTTNTPPDYFFRGTVCVCLAQTQGHWMVDAQAIVALDNLPKIKSVKTALVGTKGSLTMNLERHSARSVPQASLPLVAATANALNAM